MTARRSGADAVIALRVGAGDWVVHDARAARSQLRTAWPMGTAERTLPGGADVTIPTGWRDGQVSWLCLRSLAVDRQLAAAHQRLGTLRWRPLGNGAGLPERTAEVAIAAWLGVAAGQLVVWTVTLAVAGDVADADQT